MLDTTRAKLESMYRTQPQRGADGAMHELHASTRISPEQGELLATFHEKLRPKVSLEVGMAYGYSTLYMADAMHRGGYGYHLAIDPFQHSAWHGIALASGCCGSGYARAGMYTATATSDASDPELPTITLLQCMKD